MALISAAPASITVPSSSYSPSIGVSWSASANASNYVLEESINGGGWGVAWNGNVTSATVTVASSGTYRFEVSACGAGGCSGFRTSGDVAVTLKPASAPILPGPSSSTNGNFALSWSAVTGATRYQLNQNLNGTVTSPYNADGTSWTSSGLGDGTYHFQAFACNAAGCGPGSNGITVSVLHVPAVPASLTATPGSVGVGAKVTVSWSAVNGATSYNLKHTLSKQDGTTTTGISSMGPATSTTILNAGPAGSLHMFNAQACNASGCSGWSTMGGFSVVGHGGRLQAIPASAGSGP